MTKQSRLLLFTGAYADVAESGIQVLEFNEEAGGTLRILDHIEGVMNPTFVNVDAAGLRLYAIGEKRNRDGAKEGEVLTYAIDPESGKLTELDRTDSMPATDGKASTTCHITRSPDNRYLVVCSYHGGSIGLLPLNSQGLPETLSDTVIHTGHGADPERQDRPHPHSAVFSPDGKYLFVCDLGLDLIRAYTIDKELNTLQVHGDTKLHPGAGPRHFVFHPDGRSAYVINEVDSTITSFMYDGSTGVLEPAVTVPTLPADYTGENTCAEITVSRDGRFLYGSNRGHDTIVVYEIDPATAGLSLVEHVATHGGHPRHFTLTPDGAFLLVANRDDNNLVVFEVNRATGKLAVTGTEAKLSKPVCVQPAWVQSKL